MDLPGGESWLMRPVARGYCKYESLIDGTLHIEDLALMNDAISVQDENERRFQEANQE